MFDNRFYLNCPYDDKEECKALGGRWDNDARKWYVPGDMDKDMFKVWWPSGSKKPLFAAK